jgi:hypothetical protein
MGQDKTFRGNASQFFVAGELCRRGYSAVVTLGNTPNVDILCSDREGSRFVHIQVKTFVPGKKPTCSVGMKAERFFGDSFFWILAGIPHPARNSGSASKEPFEYHITPAGEMAHNIHECHRLWLEAPGLKGQHHKDSKMRIAAIPPGKFRNGWDISGYRNNWKLIEEKLKPGPKGASCRKPGPQVARS